MFGIEFQPCCPQLLIRYTRQYRGTVQQYSTVQEMSLFPSIFFVPLPFSLCMESTSYVLPFRMVFVYLATTGWIFDISLCENSINQINHQYSQQNCTEAGELFKSDTVQFNAEQPCPLLQRRPPANRMREHRNNRAHEEVVVVGTAAPHG